MHNSVHTAHCNNDSITCISINYLFACRTVIESLRITHVLTLCREKVQRIPGVKYLHLGVFDVPSTEISKMFAASFHFIEKAKAVKGRVLVHCIMGVSRSATIAIAYIMKTYKLPLECALTLMLRKRYVEPNEGFMQQLTEFEIEHDLHTYDEKTKRIKLEKLIKLLE